MGFSLVGKKQGAGAEKQKKSYIGEEALDAEEVLVDTDYIGTKQWILYSEKADDESQRLVFLEEGFEPTAASRIPILAINVDRRAKGTKAQAVYTAVSELRKKKTKASVRYIDGGVLAGLLQLAAEFGESGLEISEGCSPKNIYYTELDLLGGR